MPRYNVTLSIETSRHYIVDASSEAEAARKAKARYREGDDGFDQGAKGITCSAVTEIKPDHPEPAPEKGE